MSAEAAARAKRDAAWFTLVHARQRGVSVDEEFYFMNVCREAWAAWEIEKMKSSLETGVFVWQTNSLYSNAYLGDAAGNLIVRLSDEEAWMWKRVLRRMKELGL